MPNLLIIQPRKFFPRRWEATKYWAKEVQRNPRRSSSYMEPEDDGLTDQDLQDMNEYFKERDMLMPTTRTGWNKMEWRSKRDLHDRRTKRVRAEKFHRDTFGR